MSTRSRTTTVTASILILSLTPVLAAELPPPPPPPPAAEEHTCFYLRGDIGVGTPEEPTITKGGTQPTNPEIEDNLLVEVGAGCQVNRYVRADVTLGYRDAADMSEDFNDLDGELRSYTALANVYVDLAYWGAVVPYIGAGIGVAYNDLNNVTLPAGNNDAGKTAFAWAFYAGASFRLTPNFVIDAGYRFIDLGSAKSGGAAYKMTDLESHDFRIGVRWYFGS